MRAWSQTRLMHAAALVAWAALFWFLIVGGRVPLYLSTRTAWLAYLGAGVSTLGAAGYLLGARTRASEPLTRLGAVHLAVFVLPVVVLVTLPPVTLGSYAASRRTTIVGQGVVASSPTDLGSDALSLAEIAGVIGSPEGVRALAERAGSAVSLVGFVDRSAGQAADEFTLTRFMITCCPGDALGIKVRVVGVPPGKFSPDEWVRVTGKLYPLGSEVVVDAAEVSRVPRPERPYLNP